MSNDKNSLHVALRHMVEIEQRPARGVGDMQYHASQAANILREFLRTPPAIAAPGVAQGWQPIESAPKDGAHVLLANKAGVSEGLWLSDIDHGAEWEGQIGMAGWCRIDGTDWPNTHWQPLPPSPTAEQPVTLKGGPAE